MNGRRSSVDETAEEGPTSNDVLKNYNRGGKVKLLYTVRTPPGAIVDEVRNFFNRASPATVNENMLCLWAHYCCSDISETLN